MAAASTTAASPPALDTQAPRDRLSRALGAAFLSHQVDSLQRNVEDLNISRANPAPATATGAGTATGRGGAAVGGGVGRGVWGGRGGGSPRISNSGWPSPGAAAPGGRPRGLSGTGSGLGSGVESGGPGSGGGGPGAGGIGRGGGGRGRGSPGRGYANAVTGSRAPGGGRRQRREDDKDYDRSLPLNPPQSAAHQPVVAQQQSAKPPMGQIGKGGIVDDRDPDEQEEDDARFVAAPPVPQHQSHALNSILSWRAEVARDAESLPPTPLEAPNNTHPLFPSHSAPVPPPRAGPAAPSGISPIAFQRRLADRIVLDSSVLVHSLGTVRKWCSDGRREEVVVPLEALNTLDLLKKGSSPLAASARAASRYLEDQVGLNPRITVQSEEGYIPWEEVQNVIPPSLVPPPPGQVRPAHTDCPDWIKRTLCCAVYEFVQCLHQPGARKAVLAVIAPQGDRLRGDEDTARWEALADGREVRAWALEVGVLLLELGKTPRAERERERKRRSGESERAQSVGSGPGRDGSGRGRGRGRRGRGGGGGGGGGQGVIVEKPPAVEVPRVVKVLARGEKLDT